MDKRSLRKQIIKLRDKIPPEVREQKDQRIFNGLLNNSQFILSRNIFIYIGFSSEINTLKLIEEHLLGHKNVYIPFIDNKTKTMKITKLNYPDIELETNSFGILETKKKYRQFLDPNILDLIIMPGVAFDKKKHRLGYGGGYYDKFIDALKVKIPLIALAYQEQIVDNVPVDKHDKDMDLIITD